MQKCSVAFQFYFRLSVEFLDSKIYCLNTLWVRTNLSIKAMMVITVISDPYAITKKEGKENCFACHGFWFCCVFIFVSSKAVITF